MGYRGLAVMGERPGGVPGTRQRYPDYFRGNQGQTRLTRRQ